MEFVFKLFLVYLNIIITKQCFLLMIMNAWFRQELKLPREGVLFLEVKPGNTKTASLHSGNWVRHRDVQKCWGQRVICTTEPYAVLRNVKVTPFLRYTFVTLYCYTLEDASICFVQISLAMAQFWKIKNAKKKKKQAINKIKLALAWPGLFR